jgi:ATP-dependent DNA helicase RecG
VLDAPITSVKGVGERMADTLGKLGLFSVGDLLAHYPRRYEDRARFTSIRDTRDGEAATLAGKVTLVENRPTKNRLVLTKVTLDDGSGALASLVWFNQWRMKQVWEKLLGKRVVAYGVVKRGFNSVEITQPEWEALDEGEDGDSLAVGRVVPVYPATEGLSQGRLRKILFASVEKFANQVPDTLSDSLRAQRDLLPLGQALRTIHFPDALDQVQQARRRLVYDELFALQLLLADRQAQANETPGIAFADTAGPVAELTRRCRLF